MRHAQANGKGIGNGGDQREIVPSLALTSSTTSVVGRNRTFGLTDPDQPQLRRPAA